MSQQGFTCCGSGVAACTSQAWLPLTPGCRLHCLHILPQAVLDRMEDMEQRAAAPVPSSLNSSNAGGPQAAAAGSHSLDEQPARTSAPSSASAQQLCEHFSHLLQASGAGLEEVQQQLAMVQQAETAAQRMEAAAMQAALAGVQAAAQAAELSAPRQLDATKRHAAQPTGERSCGDKTAAAAASAQAVVQELHTSAVLPLAVADQAEQPTRPRPSSPAAVAVGAAAMLAASGGKAEEQPPHAEHSQRAVPPAELLQASADGSPAAAADAAPNVAAESLLDCACADSSAEPAEGWPVQWQPPVVPGIPLQLPPAAVQQMWAVPAASSCLWQPASALMPGTVAQAAPQLGAGLCWGQPVPSGMHQLQQEAAVQWEPPFAASHDGELPFSVASDEELPDSPNSSTCASPASVRSGAAAAPGERGVDFEQQDIDVWGDEQLAEERQQVQPDSEQAEQQPADAQQAELQQAKQQQAMLDELAALSIQQYQQGRMGWCGWRGICGLKRVAGLPNRVIDVPACLPLQLSLSCPRPRPSDLLACCTSGLSAARPPGGRCRLRPAASC